MIVTVQARERRLTQYHAMKKLSAKQMLKPTRSIDTTYI